ncbi:MAG TPA: asparagine synthase (glutamine-hydrolyzing) [Alphaproteobacteria bacterium]|nr:asparagine synthase (glutamine-hydrolyzing) [Alphaproteobacteria bacterium]
MCGVTAIFAYGQDAPPVDAAELARISRAMAARGPDGAGQWLSSDKRVGFAHRRLAIIDVPYGAQPMHLNGSVQASDEDTVISFNGEIYNYQALRDELIAAGYPVKYHSDTEVLLHLYKRHGRAMVEKLRGVYAFAIWDGKRRGMLVARDHLGNKQLYISDDGRTLRVASQVKALLAGGRVDTSPEPAGHVGFFLWGHLPEPYTLFRGIRAVPAGTTIWIDGQGRAERPYYSLASELAAARPGPVDLHAALLESVRFHLVADVPVGSFLSAGRDSTAITALATEAHGTDLRTITLGFDTFRGGPLDETPLAEEVARTLGTRHETYWVGRRGFESAHDDLLRAMDQPTVDGVNTYFVARVAREAGMKVALSGLGGDELFAGYVSFRQIPRLVGALGPLRGVAPLGKLMRIVSAPFLRHMTSPKYASLLEYGATYPGAYLLRRALFMPWELPELLDGEMVREGWRALDALKPIEAAIEGVEGSRLKVMAMEIASEVRNRLFRDGDWAGMAHSIEIRTPFADVTLLRQLLPAIVGPNPPTKESLPRATSRKLPAAIYGRPKTGFVAPVAEWILGGNIPSGERGLRSWARYVHDACYRVGARAA